MPTAWYFFSALSARSRVRRCYNLAPTGRRKTMAGNTIRLHRVLRASPEKVYRAFIEPEANVKWLPPHGYTGKVHHMEAKVGGTYKMSFTNFTTGHSHS